MRLHYTVALLLVSASTLSAQNVPPALMVQKDGRSVPLGLARLQTEVRIFGSVAETTSTMTFANPTPRPMEGDLYFPLPEGATISGYALDINGQMVDGVAVEKHEARRVFEEVVRHGIDPGLVQWTKGNNFQTRVFPIPANGTRTVRVQYISELIGGRQAPAYLLPLKFKDKLPEFSLRVEVVKPAAPPKVNKGELANFAFAKWHDSYVAETKQRNFLPVEDLVIALPKTDGPQVLVEKADDGQTYFAIEGYSAAPAVEAAQANVKRAVIFWDASGSRAGDHRREIVLLGQLLTKLLPDAPDAQMAVDVVLIRNAAGKPIHVALSKSNHAELTAALENVQYDGGTQLGAIGPIAGDQKPDLYLLFTDGISTFGGEEPRPLDAPLYIFSASATTNHALLHALAEANGGRYFNLANWKDADVLAQVGQAAWSLLSVRAQDGQIDQVSPKLPQPLAGRFLLTGRLKGDSATLVAEYGIPGGTSQKQTFKLSRSDAAEGTLLRRLWAQKKLADLMIHQKRNQKEIAALGKQFSMVTPYTSLLVLDALEQYVQYEIAPPKSLAKMREEYNRQIDTVEHQKQKEKSDKLADVLRMWEERVKWWESKFKYPKDFKYKGQQEDQADGIMDRAGRALGVHSLGSPALRSAAARPQRGSSAAPADAVPPPASAPKEAPKADEPPPPPAAPRASGWVQGADANRERLTTDSSAVHDKRIRSPETGAQEPGILIKPWQPDMPYLKELKAAKAKKDVFAVYMKNREVYGTSPGFFLDCADFFRQSGDNDLALQVLSNIAELELEDATLLRVLGHRLEQIGQLDLAVQTFEQVLDMRPEEPQSFRDLALVLARRAETHGVDIKPKPGGGPQSMLAASAPARADYTRAVDLLSKIVMGRWDGRFPEIEVIALEELNRIIPRAKEAGVSAIPLDKRLIKLLDVDVRIVMTWQAGNADIDLWVTEPSGEKAFYGHNRTTIGGLVSNDFTQGYGPEEYLVRRAAHGMYKIEANYFGSRATRLLGPVTVQADVYTNYGRPNEHRKSLTLRLKDAQETVRIGEIEF